MIGENDFVCAKNVCYILLYKFGRNIFRPEKHLGINICPFLWQIGCCSSRMTLDRPRKNM
jgi:hypothetical protein